MSKKEESKKSDIILIDEQLEELFEIFTHYYSETYNQPLNEETNEYCDKVIYIQEHLLKTIHGLRELQYLKLLVK